MRPLKIAEAAIHYSKLFNIGYKKMKATFFDVLLSLRFELLATLLL